MTRPRRKLTKVYATEPFVTTERMADGVRWHACILRLDPDGTVRVRSDQDGSFHMYGNAVKWACQIAATEKLHYLPRKPYSLVHIKP